MIKKDILPHFSHHGELEYGMLKSVRFIKNSVHRPTLSFSSVKLHVQWFNSLHLKQLTFLGKWTKHGNFKNYHQYTRTLNKTCLNTIRELVNKRMIWTTNKNF